MSPNLGVGSDERSAVDAVLARGQLWRGNGPRWGGVETPGGDAVDAFEDAFGAFLDLDYVLGVNSGSSANEAAIAGLGLAPGDEVVCPAASPIFVPLAVLAAGCIPVFADVDPMTLLLDPQSLESVVSERTRAVVVVHLWGYPASMPEILEVARRHDLRVVEDCAQALGTTLAGQQVGTFGDVACFSLQQSKVLSAGEGGILATQHRDAYARAVLYSNSGIPSFRHGVTADDAGAHADALAVFGHNHRMPELQAAVAITRLARLEQLVRRRAELVELITRELATAPAKQAHVVDPAPGSTVSYWRCPVLVPPGRGSYIGIPPAEPVFAHMETKRVTPWGATLPADVHYTPSRFPGAVHGAAQIRVIPLRHDQSDDEARTAAKSLLALL